jgi:excisionase family DNA binding protein
MTDYLTKREIAAMLRVSERSIERWVRDGRLAVIRTPGGYPRFSRQQVEDMMRPGVAPEAIRDSVSTIQFAAALGVSPRTVDGWVAAGQITPLAKKPNGRPAFSREQLARLLKDKAESGAPNYRPEAADPRPPKTQAELERDAREWVQRKLARRRLRRGEI